jgi:hypothetical protein
MATSEDAGPERRLALPFGERGVTALSFALAVLFSAFVLITQVGTVREAYSYRLSPGGDLAFLVAAGRLAVSDERHLLYDRPESQAAWDRQHDYIFPSHYPYPAGVAFATAPLGLLELKASMDAWRVLVALASLVLAGCVASAFGSWAWRLAIVAGVVLWEPILMNARIGQTGAFVAAGMAVASLVYLRKRELGAVLFGLIALKPTAVIGPALIVLQERPAVWLRFGVTAAAVILVPFVVLGPTAFLNWVEIILERGERDIGGGHSYNQGLSSLIGARTAIGLVVALGLVLIAGGLVRAVQVKMGLQIAMVFALLGGALVNPHSLFYDWGVAFVAIMLLRKSAIVPESAADLAFGALAISLFLAGQYTWLTKSEAGHYLRPLTAWSILVCVTILLSTLRRYLEPEPQEPPAPPSTLSAEPT